ncbi:PAS domain S-box protein, partial [Candidatus Bathyarchaeota archaeon]|nr:PAS domain S-box protein [Candidatus Bathyarchaeota archaeon]
VSRKKAEKKLRESEEEHRALLNMATMIVQSINSEGKFIYVNREWKRVLGYTEKDLKDISMMDVIRKDYHQHCMGIFKQVMDGHTVRNVEVVFVTKDGRDVVVRGNAMPRFKDGKFIATVGFFSDITERKKVEEERDKFLHDYGKRVKELRCLYGVSKLVETPDFSLDEILRGTSDLLPSAWKYPDITCSRIVYENREFKTKNFKETRWKQQADINTDGKKIGTVEVYYLKEKPTIHEGPFLKEERDLVEAVAERLGRIAERKKAEKALRESEEKYRTIVESASEAIYEFNIDGELLSANQQAGKMLGMKPESLVGRSMYGLFPTSIADQHLGAIKTVFQTGNPILNRESQTKTKSGLRWVNSSLIPIKDSNGKIVKVLGFSRNITERKIIEDKLKQSEMKYRNIFELAPDGIITIDLKGVITSVNPTFSKLTGYSKEEIVGKHFTKLGTIQARDIPRYLSLMLSALKGKLPSKFEYSYTKKNGSTGWAEGHFGSLRRDGKIIGFQGILREVTERKKALNALDESEKRYKLLLEETPVGILNLDIKGTITFVNRRLEEITGYSKEELLGRNWLSLARDYSVISDDNLAFAAKRIKERLLGRAASPLRLALKRKDGRLIWAEGEGKAIKKYGVPIGLQASFRDITDLVEAEKSLKNSLRKLETLNEKLEVVGSLTRHDIRNKLSTVLGRIFLANQKLDGNVDAQGDLVEAQRAVKETERILNFAKEYESLGKEELAYVSVKDNIKSAVSLLPVVGAELEGVKIVEQCDGVQVIADSMLQQLFYNLIDNSMKHGGDVSQIEVHCKTERNALKLTYEDNGVGVSKAEKERIFEKGYGKGTGYGLYFIKKMCEVYGWTIKETGKQSKGAQFTITIPKLNEKGKPNYKLN